ncbi:hypothetical protein MBOU_01280 [Mycobacterium bourgelatii]|uniref:Uncharacterized protein n=1 Tax=Mycobacterium bourgelatii TaxID=1273442 RepID=A0A7I9YHD2_MYCBU|nr:hypothetical protein MBOU_01280 [Mycobacterium bourgelatii]
MGEVYHLRGRAVQSWTNGVTGDHVTPGEATLSSPEVATTLCGEMRESPGAWLYNTVYEIG